jgi:membrane protein CcdC involved in cytochrome C biogenesis
MQSKAKRKIDYKKVAICLAMMALGTIMFVLPAFAAINAKEVMSNLISLMCSMFKFVGVAIFVWAVIQFILATKRSDADSKADAVQTAVCGVALMAVATIVTKLGLDSAVIDTGKINDTQLDGK